MYFTQLVTTFHRDVGWKTCASNLRLQNQMKPVVLFNEKKPLTGFEQFSFGPTSTENYLLLVPVHSIVVLLLSED